MSRSVWKGPFVDSYVLKKAEATRESGRHEVIKIWSRRSTILPQFVGLTFGVYHGHKHMFQQPGMRNGNLLILNGGTSTLRPGSQLARLIDHYPNGDKILMNTELLV